MKLPTFHHGGRIGDLIYSLYTMRSIVLSQKSSTPTGNLFLSSRQSPGWDLQMAQETIPFLKYQEYVNDVFLISRLEVDFIDWYVSRCLDYDLVDGERTTPDQFPEWVGPDFPGDIHIGKRYAVAFDLPWKNDTPWLIAPTISDVDVVFHAPLRRLVRPSNDWKEIISVLGRYLNIFVVDHLNEWSDLTKCRRLVPKNLLETATYINSCKIFLGASSSGGALAEGLGKTRYIELCPGGKGQCPTEEISECSIDEVLELVYTHVNGN